MEEKEKKKWWFSYERGKGGGFFVFDIKSYYWTPAGKLHITFYSKDKDFNNTDLLEEDDGKQLVAFHKEYITSA